MKASLWVVVSTAGIVEAKPTHSTAGRRKLRRPDVKASERLVMLTLEVPDSEFKPRPVPKVTVTLAAGEALAPDVRVAIAAPTGAPPLAVERLTRERDALAADAARWRKVVPYLGRALRLTGGERNEMALVLGDAVLGCGATHGYDDVLVTAAVDRAVVHQWPCEHAEGAASCDDAGCTATPARAPRGREED